MEQNTNSCCSWHNSTCGKWVLGIAAAVGVTGALLLLGAALNQFQQYSQDWGSVDQSRTISVDGKGTVYAKPDIATFDVSVDEIASTVSKAQDQATTKNNKIVSYLKDAGIADEDVQTTGYNIFPKYDYEQAACINYCPPSKQVLSGYEVTQTLHVKVRDLGRVGEIFAAVGSLGASNVSGLSFSIDKPDTLTAAARTKAIDDAKAKAEKLASDLGVKLLKVVSFSENGRSPYPVYNLAYGKGGSADMAAAPSIAVGQNEIDSNVTIVYAVR